MHATAIALAAIVLAAAPASGENLVANGSFELDREKPGTPDAWTVSGHGDVVQRLALDTGRSGGRSAKFECTAFSGDGPSHHAMACQVGRVAVRAGRWYRLSLWAKGENIRYGAVEVALVDTRTWDNAGLSASFSPEREWESFEFVFRARRDLPAAASRLQLWFKSTGTLWLDDVALAETAEGQRWLPEIPAAGAANLLPNSSFECGAAGWGSTSWGSTGWEGNLYRLEGEIDETAAWHGKRSLKIALRPDSLPVFWFDYYEPARRPVRRVLAANLGWIRAAPGEKLALSAYLKADAEGAVARLAVVEAPDRVSERAVTVGTEWRRAEFTFAPRGSFVFAAAGLDLEASGRDAATLWVDAVQLERGDRATGYRPRRPVESAIETGVGGNTFTDPARGASITVRAFNDGDRAETLRGALRLTDFFDAPAHDRVVSLDLPAKGGSAATVTGIAAGRRGFFRATWTAGEDTQALRLAVIDPPADLARSPIAFNHAYPWDWLVRLAGQAGVGWWRDWSAKWATVEPEKGRFDFAVPDAQIRRVLDLGGEVDVLLPFPSSSWSTTARKEEVEKAAGRDSYLRARLPVAYPPRDPADFGRYAAEVARHYAALAPRAATTFEVLNEPIYTDYALPRSFGYGLADYLRILEAGSKAMKAAVPGCRVVGGIGAGLDAGLTREFVDAGGHRLADAVDVHIYDPPRPAESYEESFRAIEERMAARGGARPIWVTEWGCYADDDPPCIPHSIGDDTMNRCGWRSERAAAEHIVKFAAVGFAHGARKLFFHAGVCGSINGPDAGGVLFEYGGAPRKMLPACSALARILPEPEAFAGRTERDGVLAYAFRVKGGAVSVVWCPDGRPRPLDVPAGATALDIEGNEIPAGKVEATATPLYLVTLTGRTSRDGSRAERCGSATPGR